MIKPDGFLDWTIRQDGPLEKVNGGINGLLGLAFHSAEGFENGMNSVLYGTRRASWHFSNMLDGRLIQHYPITAQTWTSGSGYPNNNMPGTESEGVAGTPLNDLQQANVVRLIKELETFTGRKAQRNPGQTVPDGVLAIVEHRECQRWGSASTACPSDRYPWVEIMEELMPEPEPEYTMEQQLHALVQFTAAIDLLKYFPDTPVTDRLHPFDQQVVRDLVAKHLPKE